MLVSFAQQVVRTLRMARNRLLNLIDSPVVVLLYHRVTVLQSDPELLAVSPDNFREHLKFLKNNFKIVRLEDDWSALTEPAVAITFDDGYADNVLEALPILSDVGLPATFFISTGNVGTNNEFWWHQMEKILLQEGNFPASFTLDDRQYGRIWPTITLAQRQALYSVLNSRAQRVDMHCLEGWMEQLWSWSGQKTSAVGGNRSLSEDELMMAARSPWVTIGAHAVSHAALSALTEEQQRHEIFASKATLEKISGTKVETFSYPFGNRKHYNWTSIRLCNDAGFVKAASNFPGLAHRWTDPYQLPRQVVRNWDLDTFAMKIKGFWDR